MEKCDFNSSDVPKGAIHSTIALLKDALAQLGAQLDNYTIENMGILVYQAMRMQHRSFHTPDHIFDLTDGKNPHLSLAAVFHDLVYYQVDNGFNRDIETILLPYISLDGDTIKIREDIAPSERAFYGTASVFGFKPGQTLSPFAGLNEFLSALVMNSLLEGTVSDRDLLVATAGIEMTIPFRSENEAGQSPADLLKQRITDTNEQFKLGLTEEDIDQTVVSAVKLSNCDINNFAEEDPARFLDNTWKLLPESNPELFHRGLYTIQSYALSLMKMEGFLSSLKPGSVFQQFAGYPKQDEYDKLLERTQANLSISRLYLGIKMISAGILRALADITGGDTPVSFFMGDINYSKERCSLTYYLPEITDCPRVNDPDNSVLYQLFKYGRANSSDFDLQNSPLSLFIYCNIDDDQEMQCINASRDYLKDNMSAQTYLQNIPGYIVAHIARAASFMAFTRREKLAEIADSFS